jgi:hypothetical protein
MGIECQFLIDNILANVIWCIVIAPLILAIKWKDISINIVKQIVGQKDVLGLHAFPTRRKQ